MARKRMISPEIWESQSFGELSILAKVLFIGMISQADDDGKGVLSPHLLKSKILPYDELRIADVDKALKEIGHNVSVAECADTDKAREERGHKMSVVYYEVGGKQYYLFENWHKWQTINRPIPSKLPDPVGEGESIRSHEVSSDKSVSTHGVISEQSRAIEDLKEEKFKDNLSLSARTRGEEKSKELEAFLAAHPKLEIDGYNGDISGIDFNKLSEAIEESEYLQQATSFKWICERARKICTGYYKDYARGTPKKESTNDIIDRMLEAEYAKEKDNDG